MRQMWCGPVRGALFSRISHQSKFVNHPIVNTLCCGKTVIQSATDLMQQPELCKVKVKCTLVQALRLCTGHTAHRGSRGIAVLYGHGTRRGWGVSVTPRLLFAPGKDPVPIVEEAWWAPEPVWTGAENLALTKIRSLDCPARSQLLYPLSYPGPQNYASNELFMPHFI
jgi:hypothetical protein